MSDVPVNAIQTMFTIVEMLQECGSAGVSELAEQVDLPQSTVFNHLNTLEQTGYLINNNGTYRLSCRFLNLGAEARSHHQIHDIARQKVDRLADETGEMSALLIEEHGRGIFLHRAEGRQAVHIDSYIGQQIFLHGAALGKAILASLPRDEVDDIIETRGLPELTENTITDRETLYEELDEIHTQGVAYDDQERLPGLRSVAVPLTDSKETVLGSVSIAGPTSRVNDQRFYEQFPTELREVAKAVELDLRYS